MHWDMELITYGDLIFLLGLVLVALGVLALLVGTIVFAFKRSAIRRKLNTQYGDW